MKTLADMTPEELKECVGMWCECDGNLWVVRSVYEAIGGTHCRLISPVTGTVTPFTPSDAVTLRPELPRAWNPDGTPPAGEWLTHGTHARVIPKNRRAYVTMSELEPPQ